MVRSKNRKCLNGLYKETLFKDRDLQSYLDIIDLYIANKFNKEDEYFYRKNFKTSSDSISIKADNIYADNTNISFIGLLYVDLEAPPTIRDFLLYDNIEEIKTLLKNSYNGE